VRNNLSISLRRVWRDACAKGDCRAARRHCDAAWNLGSLAWLWLVTTLSRRVVMRAALVRHDGRSRARQAVPAMIFARRVDCPDREIQGADAGQDSYKASHVWNIECATTKVQPVAPLERSVQARR